MNRIPRRVFTAQYKAEAVKLAGAVGVPTAARQREMATKSLYLWIKQSTEGKLKASGPSKLSAEQQRIRELERELAIARTECDLLKKAAAFVRLRKQHDILCKCARKGKTTTHSQHALPVASNLLDQQFDALAAPNRVWVADLTFVPTDQGWLYPGRCEGSLHLRAGWLGHGQPDDKGTGASARCAWRTGTRSLRPDSFITATVVASMAAAPTKTHWQAMACVPQ